MKHSNGIEIKTPDEAAVVEKYLRASKMLESKFPDAWNVGFNAEAALDAWKRRDEFDPANVGELSENAKNHLMTISEDTAFPSEFVTSNNNAGLTKLEYMATHIAVGIMASIGENEHTTPEHTAGISVKYANALIAELNKGQQ